MYVRVYNMLTANRSLSASPAGVYALGVYESHVCVCVDVRICTFV